MMGCRCLTGTLQRQYPFLGYRLSVDLALGDGLVHLAVYW